MNQKTEMPADDMVAMLGHELRNPLAGGLASVSAAREMSDPADPRRPFLDRAMADLGRLSELLDRYLEYGRSGNVERRQIDLMAMVQRLARRHPQVENGCCEPVHIRGDAALLDRCLENLVENSLLAGATKVRVTVTPRAGRAAIDIADDGPGISDDLKHRLFQPFVSGRGRTGLGLSLVSRIAEAHGGGIELLPASRGARFRVTIPTVEMRGADAHR